MLKNALDAQELSPDRPHSALSINTPVMHRHGGRMSTVHFGASSRAMDIMPNDDKSCSLRPARIEPWKSAGSCHGAMCAAEQFASVPDETSGARQRRALDTNHAMAKESKESSSVSSVAIDEPGTIQKILQGFVHFLRKMDGRTKPMTIDQYERHLIAIALSGAMK